MNIYVYTCIYIHIVSVHFDNHMELTNTLCSKNLEFLLMLNTVVDELITEIERVNVDLQRINIALPFTSVHSK
jgi:hypothetical protein